MRYIKTHLLDPGMTTASPLYDANGRMLLAANCRLTSRTIARLRSMKYTGVYVLDGDADAAYRPLLDDAVRQDAIRALKGLDIDQVVYVANAIVNQVIFSADAVYDMEDVCAYDMVTYMHSVNVAILSVMAGVAMGLDNESLHRLGQSALLHDIGKTCIDSGIIKAARRLTPEEFDEVRRHPRYGYDILARSGAVPQDVMEGALYHHENLDGTGYPEGIAGDSIPLFARIIHVADVYDALVSDRPYKKGMNPADALENLMANSGTMFDPECVRALMGNVALYPAGSEVVLSNGCHAWVQENRRSFPTRPLLRTETGMRIDLMDRRHLNVTIVRFAGDCHDARAAIAV